MSGKIKRNIVVHLNKYQRCILYPVLISCLITCVSSLMCLAYIYYPEKEKVFGPVSFGELKMAIPWILIGFAVAMVILVFWTYLMSNRLVGPYDRVVRELDDVLSGKRKKPITIRKGDEMFEGLLKRINTLIK